MAFFGKKPENKPAVPSPARPEPGKDPARKSELSELDFTAGGDNGRGPPGMEVQEVGGAMSAVAEEAAVLYANGSMQQAEHVLNGVLESPDGGAHAGEGLWMMLLDLYRLTGQRARFDAKVIEYATRFEKSPPPWEDLSAQAERRAPGPPLVNLAGNLSGQAAQQLGQIEVIGRKSGAIRIDLGRLRGIDEAGCTLLWNAVSRLVADRIKLNFVNCGQALALLEGRLAVGRAESQEAWLLLLELLQHSGEHARFEQWAVDYAVTFEVSPPSWETRAPAAAPAVVAAAPVQGVDPSRLEGELTSATPEVLRRLAALASQNGRLEVDCSRLRRIDFVSAGTLFNILATLQAQGKLVVLHNVNAMVAALLRVMGVDQVAQVDLRG